MCGRYALSLRPSIVRQRLADQNMEVEEAPEDDDEQVRQTYNFAPGYHGMIYRAATSDHGAEDHGEAQQDADGDNEPPSKRAKLSQTTATVDGLATQATKYKLQTAKWGLIPFWTKRPPDYGSQLRTINCRDDSLIENRGMWNTMKQRKRCIVVAEGFYEWLKKNNGKEKIPHFVKRKDGELMCFAGLWDMVKYDGSDDKLYTYTIITTDSNAQLKFLHDRMPVIMEPGSEVMRAWLDPHKVGWSKELQSSLIPFAGELECFPVDKAVGKVGNNSPSFVIPVNSKENKSNIANFFGAQAAKSPAKRSDKTDDSIKHENDEPRETDANVESTEDNAPLPKPEGASSEALEAAIDNDAAAIDDKDLVKAADDTTDRAIKHEITDMADEDMLRAASSSPQKLIKHEYQSPSPAKTPSKQAVNSSRKTRSATTNNTVAKTPKKDANTKITSFFGK